MKQWNKCNKWWSHSSELLQPLAVSSQQWHKNSPNWTRAAILLSLSGKCRRHTVALQCCELLYRFDWVIRFLCIKSKQIFILSGVLFVFKTSKRVEECYGHVLDASGCHCTFNFLFGSFLHIKSFLHIFFRYAVLFLYFLSTPQTISFNSISSDCDSKSLVFLTKSKRSICRVSM